MIIYGSRMYGRRNLVKGWGYCEHCKRYAKLTSYNGRRWGHLYFIPLIPEGPRVRVVKECAKCSRGLHIPEANMEAAVEDWRQSSAQALAALRAGQRSFERGGATSTCAAALAGAVEMLPYLGEEALADEILAELEKAPQSGAFHLVSGQRLESAGKPDEAMQAYMRAAGSDPADAAPLIWLGALCRALRRCQEAAPLYEKALDLAGAKPPILATLVKVYQDLKDYPRLAATYERLLAVAPELAQDKAWAKEYRRACKKAGAPCPLG